MSDSGEPHRRLTQEGIAALAQRLDELETKNERLRERVIKLEQQPRVEFRNDEGHQNPRDLYIGRDYGVGHAICDLLNRVEQLEQGSVEPDEQRISSDALGQLLPIHRMLLDLSNGREDSLPGATARRATRLYQAFVRRASGKTDRKATLIDATNNTYTLSSTGAKEILEWAGDIPKGGKSKTVSRAMGDLESLSRRESDEKPLLKFDDSGGTNYIVANKPAFEEELERVWDLLSGGNSTDDPSEEDGEATVRDVGTRDPERTQGVDQPPE